MGQFRAANLSSEPHTSQAWDKKCGNPFPWGETDRNKVVSTAVSLCMPHVHILSKMETFSECGPVCPGASFHVVIPLGTKWYPGTPVHRHRVVLNPSFPRLRPPTGSLLLIWIPRYPGTRRSDDYNPHPNPYKVTQIQDPKLQVTLTGS